MLLEVEDLSVGIEKRGSFRPPRGGWLPSPAGLLSVVEGVSFTIDAGEIVGLLGESGCGKTITSLSIPRLLPRNVRITGGRISFQGTLLHRLPEKALCALRGKEIAMIFQEPMTSLNPLQRVRQQIGETLLLHGERDRTKVRNRTLELLEALGLQESDRIMDAYPHQLSGGICQRVMIALAVIARPRLLIADEPTSALDVRMGAQILDLLRGINWNLGTSILFISHDLRLLRSFCTRTLVMYAGKLLEEGPTEEVFSHPLHEYTRGLLGAVPRGELRGHPLASIPGRIPSLEEGRPPGCPFAPRCARSMPACSAAFPPARIIGRRRVHCLRAGDGL
jgi:oligopeptide/dipeptide ABC transporter ATP-binding protein